MHVTTTAFVGRSEELATLAGFVEEARAGRGGTVLIFGEAGMGITRLAEEALERSGFSVLTGRAREGGTPSYGPIAAALRDCLRADPRLRKACGPLGSHLALLLPELGSPPEGADPGTLVEAIGAALAAKAARHPTALFLDDLQSADLATLELLPYLDDRLSTEPLLVLATCRTDETPRTHPIRSLRRALRRARRLREVLVGPMDREQSAALIGALLGRKPAPDLVERIQERTQGYPLYVEEVAAALASEGRLLAGAEGCTMRPGDALPLPESIRDAFSLRLHALTPAARAYLEAAAVAGQEFDLELPARLTGNSREFETLVVRGLLFETAPGRGRFRHSLARDAVREEIEWSRRLQLHRQVAAFLEESGAAAEIVAGHWRSGKELVRSRRAFLSAAERSCRLHAYADAAQAIRSALEDWPEGEEEADRAEALRRLAYCAQVSGRLNEAAEVLRALLSRPLVAEDTARRAEALRALATVHQLQGEWEQSVRARRAAAEAFEELGETGEAAVERLALAGRLTAALRYEPAREAAQSAARLAEEAERWDVRARALGLEGNLLAMQGDVAKGKERVHAGLSLALKHNLTEAASEIYRRLGSVREFASDYTGARDAYFAAVDYCRTEGKEVAARVCLGCVSYMVYRTGEWKRALEVCKQILEESRGDAGARVIADGIVGLVRAQRGEVKPARRLLQRSLATARRYRLTAMELTDLYSLAVLGENEGDDAAAAQYYQEMLQRWAGTEEKHDIIPWLCWACTFFASRRREQEATICAEHLAALASGTANPEALAGLAHALGEVALLQGRPEEAAEQFRQAWEQLERLGIPLEQALARGRLGAALALCGRRSEAGEELRCAHAAARKLGARPLADRIARELEELGEGTPAPRGSGPKRAPGGAALTQRQIEILGLLGSGMTNKEIALRLFLSSRTVDMHVGHILARLDCRSRAEAVAKAHELGLLT